MKMRTLCNVLVCALCVWWQESVCAETPPECITHLTSTPWLATIPTNVLIAAEKAEDEIKKRVVWTEELKARCEEVVSVLVNAHNNGAGGWMQDFEEGDPHRPINDYHVPIATLKTNAFVVGLLLRHNDKYVRGQALEYFRRVMGSTRVQVYEAYTNATKEVGRERYIPSKHDPIWVREIVQPLVRRSMFDIDLERRYAAIAFYEGIDATSADRDIAELALNQGTNNWAIERWVSFYRMEYSRDLIPTQMLESIREIVKESDDAKRREMKEVLLRGDRREKERENNTNTVHGTQGGPQGGPQGRPFYGRGQVKPMDP